MVEIVNTLCSWVMTRCADKSTAEYTKYIYIAISPHQQHTHTHTRTHAQTNARTNTYIMDTYLIPYPLAVFSINSLERDGLRQAEFCPCYIMDNRPNVGFLVHKDIGSAVLGCRPVSSRLISIRSRAAPFNVTIYAPTSGYNNNEVNNFCRQLQEIIEQTPIKDILVVLGDWNAKVGRDAQAD